MATSFATELREGYLQVAGYLCPEELELVARARDLVNVRAPERNRLLAQIVCAYRSGPRQVWGPVILDLLAPALIEMLQEFRPEPPAIDEEEIRQQLVLEALQAAARIRLLEGGRQTKWRLISRAYTGMLRWLGREGRRQRRQVSSEPQEDE